MADVNRGNRPLSPHLSIYRPQLTSMTSILTRITGNAMLIASLLLTRITGNAMLIAALLIVWWFLAAATSESYFAVANGFLTSWFGDLVLFFSLWGMWYHTLAGVRHLIWDNAIGLEIKTAEKMGYAVIGGSIVLTLLTVIII